MKRSEINSYLRHARGFFREHRFQLPPWAFWSVDQWRARWGDCREIRDNALGWDLTDFGGGDFERRGLLLFSIRNGNHAQSQRYPKPYAEKIMIVRAGQVTPMHYHWKKMEDIINRGGGELLIELYLADERDGLSGEGLEVQVDGITRRLPAGSVIRLHPGESISLPPRLFHRFWGEEGKGDVLVGEVSMVNDDAHDNNFYEALGRFPEIEEDEPMLYPLCTEYERLAPAS
jgi:D-lyxose ketol-isomerase